MKSAPHTARARKALLLQVYQSKRPPKVSNFGSCSQACRAVLEAGKFQQRGFLQWDREFIDVFKRRNCAKVREFPLRLEPPILGFAPRVQPSSLAAR